MELPPLYISAVEKKNQGERHQVVGQASSISCTAVEEERRKIRSGSEAMELSAAGAVRDREWPPVLPRLPGQEAQTDPIMVAILQSYNPMSPLCGSGYLPSYWSYLIQPAIDHYNAKHPDQEFDMKTLLTQNCICFEGHRWWHFKFQACSRKEPSKVKLFFAELHCDPRGRGAPGQPYLMPIPIVESCSIIEPPFDRYRRSCAFCSSRDDILHPATFICGHEGQELTEFPNFDKHFDPETGPEMPSGAGNPSGSGYPYGSGMPYGAGNPYGVGYPYCYGYPSGSVNLYGSGYPYSSGMPSGSGMPYGYGYPSGSVNPYGSGYPYSSGMPSGSGYPYSSGMPSGVGYSYVSAYPYGPGMPYMSKEDAMKAWDAIWASIGENAGDHIKTSGKGVGVESLRP